MASSVEDVEERAPLLRDVEHVRKAAPPTEDSHRLLQVSKYMNANIPWVMFLDSTVGWALVMVSCSSSWVFLLEVYPSFTPKCSKSLCYVTGISFWTLPLFCMLAGIGAYAQNLYNLRLYYECLLHRIMLNYSNMKFFQSPMAWLLFCYASLAMAQIIFIPEARGLLNDRQFAVFSGMVVYAVPLFSCMMGIARLWQPERQVIPLPKFYETDPDLARRVFAETLFVPELVLQVAFEQVEELRLTESLPSSEYFGLLAEFARREMELYRPEALPRGQPPLHERVLSQVGLVRADEFTQRQVSRPDLLGWSHQLRHGGFFWVQRLLHSRQLDDSRSRAFRRWARVHLGLAAVVALCIAEVYKSAVRDFLKHESELP